MIAVFLHDLHNKQAFSELLKSYVLDCKVVYSKLQIQESFDYVLVDLQTPVLGFDIERQVHLGDGKSTSQFKLNIETVEGILEYASHYQLKDLQETDIFSLSILADNISLDTEVLLSTLDKELENSGGFSVDSDLEDLADQRITAERVRSEEKLKDMQTIEAKNHQIAAETKLKELAARNSQKKLAENNNETASEVLETGIFTTGVSEISSKGLSEILEDYSDKAAQPTKCTELTRFKQPDIPAMRITEKRGPLVGRGKMSYSNIVVFFGASSKCGASTLAYSLACELSQEISRKVLLIDLDIAKPGLTSDIYALNKFDVNDDCNVASLFLHNFSEYSANLEYLVHAVENGESRFSFLGGSVPSDFQSRAILSSYDYGTFISYLSKEYNTIVIDAGKFTGASAYQMYLLRTTFQKIFVLSCSTKFSLEDGIISASVIPYDFDGVLNLCTAKTNEFIIQKALHRPIIGKLLARPAARNLWKTGKYLGNLDNESAWKEWKEFSGNIGGAV